MLTLTAFYTNIWKKGQTCNGQTFVLAIQGLYACEYHALSYKSNPEFPGGFEKSPSISICF